MLIFKWHDYDKSTDKQKNKPARKNVLSPSSETIMTESALTKLSRKLSVIAFVATSPVWLVSFPVELKYPVPLANKEDMVVMSRSSVDDMMKEVVVEIFWKNSGKIILN